MLRDREAFGIFVLSTSAMETCVDPWVQLFLEASACQPAHVAGGFALMLNQLLLGVGGKADSNYAGLVLPGGARCVSLSLFLPPYFTVCPAEQLRCCEAVFTCASRDLTIAL